MYCKAGAGGAVRLVLAAMLLLGVGCSHRGTQQRPEFLAVLRFENVGPDPGADWMGRAFSEIISSELAGAPNLYAMPSGRLHALDRTFGVQPVSAPGIASERDLALASGATRIGYGDYVERAGRLEARLTIENPQSGKMMQVIAASAPVGDVLAAATALARQILPAAKAYDTSNEQAVRLYVEGLETADSAAAAPLFEASIAADPKYGPPYRLLARIKSQHGDAPGAEEVLRQGLARGSAWGALEDARMEFELAGFEHDGARQQRALATQARLDPCDPSTWQVLADLASERHDYGEAMIAYRKALAIRPSDPQMWNQLGYAAASAGELSGAMAALGRYETLRPSDPNALDSMGDVNLILGHLDEAERYYLRAYEKDHNFLGGGDLFKAAMARLMAGDVAGADALDKKWIAAREAAHDPMAAFRAAEWLWTTGRREQAIEFLGNFAAANERAAGQDAEARDLASHAYAETAIWKLLLGRRAAGAADARKAVQLRTPSSTPAAGLAQFLAQPGPESAASAAEWNARADRTFPNAPPGSAKDLMLGYALLLDGNFQDAVAPLQRVYDSSGPAQQDLAVLLGWAYLESDRTDRAAPLLRLNPVPPVAGVSPFGGFSFPRLYYLRGELAARQGNTEAARANYKLFLQLSGSTPLKWGEEKKARAGV